MFDKPREVKPGDELTADMWNSLVRFVVANTIQLGQDSGLEGSRGRGGTALRATGGFALSIAKTTTIITAASGSTLGSGSIQLETGSGTSIADPGGTPPTYTVYSNDDQRVASGAYVVVAPFRDGYILLHARCGNLL